MANISRAQELHLEDQRILWRKKKEIDVLAQNIAFSLGRYGVNKDILSRLIKF